MDNATAFGFVLLVIVLTLDRTKGQCSFGKFGVDCRYSCNCPDGCDQVTGVCQGPCYLGWLSGHGALCQTSVCIFGKFGVDCRYSCNCPDGCDQVTGVCQGPCYLGWLSGHGALCQTKNIAYKKYAQQSSTYNLYQAYYGPNRAVDGNRDQNLYNGSCSHTDNFQKIAWWEVYLNPPIHIHQVKIFYRNETRLRFRRFTLKLHGVDNAWRVCYHHQEDTIESIFSVNCNISVKTKILQVYNQRNIAETSDSSYQNNAYVELCEVEVYVCSNGTYGDHCDQFCYCKDGPCDFITGQCPGSGACEPGFIGESCQTDCSYLNTYGDQCVKNCTDRHCENSVVCPRDTGRCPHTCAPGYRGIDCTEQCSAGYYGKDCVNRCGNCLENTICDPVTGACPLGCLVGWNGATCNEDCRLNNAYGVNCSMSCDARHCYIRGRLDCDRVSGQCVDGCLDGWREPDCSKHCQTGFYGRLCSLSCGNCADTSQCDHISGLCSDGCLSGWYGAYCKQDCAAMSRYGMNCSGLCDDRKCEGSSDCRRTDGLCQNGCQLGWTGMGCSERCPNGTYGRDCTGQCGQCQTGQCDYITGQCPGACSDGFQGSLCAQSIISAAEPPSAGLEIGIIGGIVVGSVAAVLIVIVLGVFLIRRRIQSASSKSENGSLGQSNRNILTEEKINNSIAYGNIGFDQSDVDSDSRTYMNVEVNQDTYYNVNFKCVVTGIAVGELAAFLAQTSEEDFLKEFNELPAGFTTTYEESQKRANRPKNKFQGYYPYDYNRVVLQPIPDTPNSDYINASFISSLLTEKRYIAAQAPKDITVSDFWRMIWQEGCHTIVMVTNLVEMGKPKCYKYWPETKTDYGDIKVTMDTEIMKTFYTVRLLKAVNKKTNEERSIKQFHFTSWSDHDTADAMNLVEFMWLVKSWHTSKSGPMLVHCSAGIGRTGAYISIDALIDEGQLNGKVDVKRFVSQLRGERKNMIQTVEQYSFIYMALLEAFLYGNTITEYEHLKNTYSPNNFKIGSKTLDELCQTVNNEMQEQSKEDQCNLYLHGSSTPCNAVQIPSQRRLLGVIVYWESVVDETVWDIVFDHHCSTIIHLVATREDSDGLLSSSNKMKNFEFSEPRTETISNELTLITSTIQKNDESRDIHIITLHNWSGDIPSCDAASVINVMDNVRSNQLVSPHPVLVLHSGQCSEAGLFCIVFNMLQGIALSGDVEVINNARRVLRSLPTTTISEEVIKYCYSIALSSGETTNIYANM